MLASNLYCSANSLTGASQCISPSSGNTLYCCPSGQRIDGSNCVSSQAATPTATSTGTGATPTATATATSVGATATPTATATATSYSGSSTSQTATPTAFPVPATGSSWMTYMGIGAGVFVILASFLLAL